MSCNVLILGFIALLAVIPPGNAFAARASVATYQVPVSQELKGFDEFRLTAMELTTINGLKTLTFTMPEELVGKVGDAVTLTEIKTDLVANQVLFKGSEPGESASCIFTGTINAVCLIHYGQMHADTAALHALLAKRYKDTMQIQKKMSVALAFSNEPIGILKLTFEK